ncbi:MAG: hypothetical protein EOP48_27905 [Sphingobacteriales bacterium]|nr:MAG: hypothetical protein EOP48_27905 [Sphingobacteriales bacterium]
MQANTPQDTVATLDQPTSTPQTLSYQTEHPSPEQDSLAALKQQEQSINQINELKPIQLDDHLENLPIIPVDQSMANEIFRVAEDAKNEAQANFYWAPLTFAEDGSIKPMECLSSFSMKKTKIQPSDEFTAGCDIGKEKQRSQFFTADKSGVLKSFTITTLKSGYPNQDFTIDFYESESGKVTGNKALVSITVPQDSIGWSARNQTVKPMINLTKGKQYVVILSSKTSQGCYGFASGISKDNNSGVSALSTDGGKNFTDEKNTQLKYNLLIE